MKKEAIYRLLPELFFLICAISVFGKPFGDGDELWNYNFARGIAQGLLPYRDISMIPTPLSAYVSAVFVFLFGGGLFSFRIASAALFYLVLHMLNAICAEAAGNRTAAFAFTSFVFALLLPNWSFDYNILSLFIILAAMNIFLKHRQADGSIYVVSLLFGLLPVIKQNTGAFMLLGSAVIVAVGVLRREITLRKAVVCALISAAPASALLIFLAATGCFPDFLEYAVFGVGTFSHRITYFEFAMQSPISFIFALFPPVALGLAARDMIVNGYDAVKFRFTVVSLSWMPIIYPLCDSVHFFCAVVPLVPLVLLTAKKQKPMSGAGAAVCCAVAVFASLSAAISFAVPSDGCVISDLPGYEHIPIDAGVEESIRTVDEYIARKESEGFEVLIADKYAAAYMIPLGRYNKNWDSLLVGNLGRLSVEDLLKNDGGKPRLYLVMRELNGNTSMQSHFELIGYIKENYTKTDEVLGFDIYKER